MWVQQGGDHLQNQGEKKADLPVPWFWTSSLRNYEKIIYFLFVEATQFVMTAPENQDTI